jgi:predicted site-specific integrase-resolvase
LRINGIKKGINKNQIQESTSEADKKKEIVYKRVWIKEEKKELTGRIRHVPSIEHLLFDSLE